MGLLAHASLGDGGHASGAPAPRERRRGGGLARGLRARRRHAPLLRRGGGFRRGAGEERVAHADGLDLLRRHFPAAGDRACIGGLGEHRRAAQPAKSRRARSYDCQVGGRRRPGCREVPVRRWRRSSRARAAVFGRRGGACGDSRPYPTQGARAAGSGGRGRRRGGGAAGAFGGGLGGGLRRRVERPPRRPSLRGPAAGLWGRRGGARGGRQSAGVPADGPGDLARCAARRRLRLGRAGGRGQRRLGRHLRGGSRGGAALRLPPRAGAAEAAGRDDQSRRLRPLEGRSGRRAEPVGPADPR
mmetsp:Transcript_1741/g.6820  ORF Transcript_1741/g.6820 Transcript_1741/m.6820 type:complete len:301 (+) Transcript_1741:1465-2367(+)